MRLVCISDTHMAHRGLHLPDGDVLIHAGDATSTGTFDEVGHFLAWFAAQPHRHKLLIAGNHDWLYQRHPDMVAQLLARHPGITYLEDSGVDLEGVRFWGSPWQPWFMDWAFNLPRKGPRLREMWNRIPLDLDVLITHGPPHGILDQVHGGEHLGCEELKIRLAVVKPRVHVFGHIHDGFGVAQSPRTTYVNASTCTEAYRASNRPIVLDLVGPKVILPGVGSNPRKAQLIDIQAKAGAAQPGPLEKTEAWLPEAHLSALKGMAEVRGLAPEALLREYALRGLRADLARHLRSESKPANRPVPHQQINDEG
jgi:predicted phosphodiesterase